MNTYLLLKSLHLISVISWMVGLLYLPRIFVYHSENKDHKNTSKTFKTMEKKLFNYIMMPAMILTWLFGLLLVSSLGFSVFLQFNTLVICSWPQIGSKHVRMARLLVYD